VTHPASGRKLLWEEKGVLVMFRISAEGPRATLLGIRDGMPTYQPSKGAPLEGCGYPWGCQLPEDSWLLFPPDPSCGKL